MQYIYIYFPHVNVMRLNTMETKPQEASRISKLFFSLFFIFPLHLSSLLITDMSPRVNGAIYKYIFVKSAERVDYNFARRGLRGWTMMILIVSWIEAVSKAWKTFSFIFYFFHHKNYYFNIMNTWYFFFVRPHVKAMKKNII